jgi:hypothetical protein
VGAEVSSIQSSMGASVGAPGSDRRKLLARGRKLLLLPQQ